MTAVTATVTFTVTRSYSADNPTILPSNLAFLVRSILAFSASTTSTATLKKPLKNLKI